MVLISATAEHERNGARMMRKARSSESRDLYNVTSIVLTMPDWKIKQ